MDPWELGPSLAGVKINPQAVSPTVLFGPNYRHWRLTQDFWVESLGLADILRE
jgi:hypothetical protein